MSYQYNNKTSGSVLRSLISLSIPTVIEHVMNTAMQYVDTAMVGRLGPEATASVSTTTSINWLAASVPFAVSTAALALIARANGAGDEEQTRRLAGQSFILTIIVGLIMTGLCLGLSPLIPVWMGADPGIRPAATMYFAIACSPFMFRCFSWILGGAIRAVKDTRTPMYINLFANVLNVLLNAFLIYGLGMGVRGAAIATALAYTASGILMFIAFRRNPKLRFGRQDLKWDGRKMKQLCRIAFPAMGASAASTGGHVVFTGLVSGMGTFTFAAHALAVTAEELFYIPGYGLRTATSALIGNALGENDEAKLRATERLSILITVGVMVLTGLTLYISAYPLMKLFTIDDGVARLGARMLRLVAFTEPFYGMMVVMEGIFYGKGRTGAVFAVESFSMWGIRIVMTFCCVRIWHLDLFAVWCCMIADNIFKASMLFMVYLISRKKERAKPAASMAA